MSSQPPYGNPPGGYPPPPGGSYPPPGGGYPPPQGGGFPPPQGGGFPPPGGGGYGYGGGGGLPPPQDNKTKIGGLSYNVAAMLCYIPSCLCCINLIPCILWLASEPKESRFVRFHALQGLLLWGVYFAIYIIFYVLSIALGMGKAVTTTSDNPFGAAFAGGNLILSLIQMAIVLAIIIVHIIGMIKANQGQMWKLPLIGDIAEKNS
ncbi:MAG: DUF4870 domain-containing protein [Acidobacteriota bacterium]